MSSRREESEESSSVYKKTGEGFLYKWRMRRAEKQFWEMLSVALEEHLDSGAPIEDFLIYRIDEMVEWEKSLQCWIIRVSEETLGDLVMEPGSRVRLSNSRGGATEDARIEEVIGDFIDAKSGKSGIIYSLRFEPLEKTSE